MFPLLSVWPAGSLDSFEVNPSGAGAVVTSLIEMSLNLIKDIRVPKDLVNSTHIYLGATAGMRLLRFIQISSLNPSLPPGLSSPPLRSCTDTFSSSTTFLILFTTLNCHYFSLLLLPLYSLSHHGLYTGGGGVRQRSPPPPPPPIQAEFHPWSVRSSRSVFNVLQSSSARWRGLLLCSFILFHCVCRSRNPNASSEILAASYAAMKKSNYLAHESARIISGQEEAAGGWVTANYLKPSKMVIMMCQ